MKIFHLSDLHIGLKLMNKDLIEDQRYILNQIVDQAIEQQPDVVVIAGDIYDKAIPSAEAVELFDSFTSKLSAALPNTELMMISGNHDSAPRVNLFRSVLKHQRIHMIGMPPQKETEYIEKITLQDGYGKVNFYLLPFVKPSMVKQIVGQDENGNNLSYNATIHKLIEREELNLSERNVLVSHQFYLPVGMGADEMERMDSETRTVGNIDEVKADILERFDYVALGHIHKPMSVGSDRIRYCGTPLACSITEAGQPKGILMVELKEKEDVDISVLPLIPKRQLRVISGTLQEVLDQSCDDYVVVVLTDKVDFNVIDMQAQIRAAFPCLLEIRRENVRGVDYSLRLEANADKDPFSLCNSFLGDLDEAEQDILRDVINCVQEVY